MIYIALLVALMVGGYTIFQQYTPSFDQSGTLEQNETKQVIEEVKDAVALIEDRSGEKSSPTTTPDTAVVALSNSEATLLVAGGCFWCVEADLEKLPGVVRAVSGYAGGSGPHPTYETYANNGYREVVLVTYDTSKVTFEQVLLYAMKHMDPTDDHGSFNDRGDYYAPAFYYATEQEKKTIGNLLADINTNGPYKKPLAIDIEPISQFFAAEAYHQDYYKGTLTKFKYEYYRTGSGRNTFIESVWGTDTGPTVPWRTVAGPTVKEISSSTSQSPITPMWKKYIKPDVTRLQAELEPITFSVTQKDGTEKSGSSPLDKMYEPGIFVDVLSGEPLFSSRDKYDSGTGWPSFVRPIELSAVIEQSDNTIFTTRIEVRSAIADNHLGHVFPDGPADRGGMRYCMNGVALKFIPKDQMEILGYGDYLDIL